MLKTNGHGSIRKVKGGAVGIITLATLFVGAANVSANEATVTDSTAQQTQLTSTQATPDKSEAVDPQKDDVKAQTNEQSNGVSTQESVKPANNTVTTNTDKSEKSESVSEPVKAVEDTNIKKEVPQETDTHSFKKIENDDFNKAKAEAKQEGVNVKEDVKPTIVDAQEKANAEINKQTTELKNATTAQKQANMTIKDDKEKLKEAGIVVKDNKPEVFTDLKKMEDFVKKQSQEISSEIETKHKIDNGIQLLTKELKDAGIEVIVEKEVVKSSSKEALEALAQLQAQASNAIKTKNELDKAVTELQDYAKKSGLLTKEGKTIVAESADEAKLELERQTKEIKSLISALNEQNAKLSTAIANAESHKITVTKDTVKSENLESATKLVSEQVTRLNNLVKSVDESKKLISDTVLKAKTEGVVLEGTTTVNLTKDESNLKEKVATALKELQDATEKQVSTRKELVELIQYAKSKGLITNVAGNKQVKLANVSEELKALKTKIDEAVAKQNKAQADYEAALAKAKSAGRLVDGSTATKDGDVYKQSLTIKSGGTKGSVSLKATGSAEIVSVELIDPSGKKVESVKTLSDLTSYTDFGKEGNYTLNYTFRAKDLTSGSVVSSASTQGIAAVEGKEKGTFSLTTKAPVNKNVTNEYKPTVLDVVLDFSSSYRYKIFDSIDQAKMLINEALTNKDSKVIIQAYTYNSDDTYAVKKNGTGSNGYSTTLLTKAEALKILDELKVLVGKNPSISDKYFPNNFEGYFAAIEKTFGDKNYVLKNADAVVPFEDVVKEVTKPTDLVSVIQFTDGWNGGEEVRGVTTPLETIDTSFAEWAKGRAKTFMSVVNKNVTKASEGEYDKDTNSEQSIKDMTRVGHPNIYDMTGKDRSVVDKELLAKFKETAIEKVTSTKGENQTVAISIVGTNTAKVTKATLKGATNKDLPIKDGKVNFTEKLPDGSWTVDYELSGDGQVTVTATVAGKEVVKETKNLKEVKGVEGSNTSKTDNLKAVVLPKAPEKQTIDINNLSIVAKNVELGTIETKASNVTVEKEISKVTFKEKVTPITFEKAVTPVQAEVTTKDVYVKSEKPRLKPKAEKVEPVCETPSKPTYKPKAVLPHTAGGNDTTTSNIGLAVLATSSVLATLGLAKRKKND